MYDITTFSESGEIIMSVTIYELYKVTVIAAPEYYPSFGARQLDYPVEYKL